MKKRKVTLSVETKKKKPRDLCVKGQKDQKKEILPL
jgi:hypothetical protein